MEEFYTPNWEDGFIKGLAKNQVYKNYLRFVSIGYTFDDLMQESVIVFCKCREIYKSTLTSKNFVCFYKTALNNHFTTIQRKNNNYVSEHIQLKFKDDFECDVVIDQTLEHSQNYNLLIARMPNDIKKILDTIIIKKIKPSNNKLCESMGYNKRKIDLVVKLKNYVHSM